MLAASSPGISAQSLSCCYSTPWWQLPGYSFDAVMEHRGQNQGTRGAGPGQNWDRLSVSGCLATHTPSQDLSPFHASAHLSKTLLLRGWLLPLMIKIQADPKSAWPSCSILNIYLKRNKNQQKGLKETPEILNKVAK